MTYAKRSGESNADAGDQYIGLDRFGRVVDQRWVVASSGTATDRFQYGYDRASNRLWRDNTVNTAFGELYAYDDLNQLTSFDRGTLNGTKTGLTGSASRSQDWDFDAVGNWDSLTTDGGSPESRTHNKQNELTQVGSNNLAFDANGNLTTDETGKTLVYDAWNRLVAYKNGGTTLASYQYDGLGRRVVENPGTARDLYYSAAWQVVEERVGGNAQVSYVWSPVYVDALICRDRDTDANGSLDERLYAQQDANFNVTALVNTSGSVVERFAYDPYGTRTVYDASWTVRSGGSIYSFGYGFQGRPLDGVSGNYDFRGRWVRPPLGRPIQVDMLRFGAGDVNFYRWEANAPVNHLDPSGLDVIFLYDSDPNVALGHGHAAVLIGNDTQGYQYYSFAPTSALATVYEGKCELNIEAFHRDYTGKKFADLRNEPYLRRYTQHIRFTSTPEEDKKAIAAAEKWRKKEYTFECNCVNLAASVLKAAGIEIPFVSVGSSHSMRSRIVSGIEMVIFVGEGASLWQNWDAIASPANTMDHLLRNPIPGRQSDSGAFSPPRPSVADRIGRRIESIDNPFAPEPGYLERHRELQRQLLESYMRYNKY